MSEVATYLGQKGYTILKESLSIQEQEYLRRELTVKPYMPGSPAQLSSFPVYRESNNKFYIPRYFGEDIYGTPDENRLPTPTTIDIGFSGGLRDYQNKIVDIYLSKKDEGGGLLEVPCGRGKTVIALNIISKLKYKTMVIVHKGFLVDQWIERISQFLPTARIGKIQGQIIDIEDKDIVIGMLQSLSMKNYPQTLFSSFGLLIVDEVHHIAAEVFVRSLFKIVTKNVLGLSATMQRKDGLSKVFKMFLGDIIYKEKREGTDNVLVKAYNYSCNDNDFNSEVLDYRGNIQYSTMISKLCAFNNRSEFILDILQRTRNDDPSQQIMILAHNKNLLTYLYKGVEHRNIGSVGYYVGGMKKDQLKESEEKEVIIATYSMAAEALDIKTLTTLIMATPKTDVTQAVGRILRAKHGKPLVIDIVDSHDVFKKQWMKRRKYYIKENYKIIQTDDKGESWETIYEPGMKKVSKKIKDKEEPLKGKCLIKL